VASNQVVVGVTSYGRSYGMADGNCYGENCLYTGSALVSKATKGRCTDTGGYISDVEIKEIIVSGMVYQNFVSSASHIQSPKSPQLLPAHRTMSISSLL